MAEGYAAAAVLAMPDQHLAAQLAQLFRTKRFRVYTVDDVLGVEMAGALKNVYAIAVGMGYSLGIGENTRAMVIARSVREMSKLGEAMGGQRDTFAGLAGMGDLIVTCTSQRSRNRHVGEQLGAGKPIDEIISSMNQVAEGVKAASVIMEFANEFGLNMPIAREVDAVINHGSTVEQAVDEYLADLEDDGGEAPEPITQRKYSGKFMVRTSPTLHARLAVEAAEQNVSINHWVVQKLSDRPPIGLFDL